MKKPNKNEVYSIECPICGKESKLVWILKNNEAVHRCPEHDNFTITWDGKIKFWRKKAFEGVIE